MKLVINGVDFMPFVVQGGIQQTEIYRQTRSVVSLDGIEYRCGVPKRKITVQLGLVRGDAYAVLLNALRNPAQVRYTDMRHGELVHIFYASEPAGAVKVEHNGNVWWSGAGFTLEEK